MRNVILEIHVFGSLIGQHCIGVREDIDVCMIANEQSLCQSSG